MHADEFAPAAGDCVFSRESYPAALLVVGWLVARLGDCTSPVDGLLAASCLASGIPAASAHLICMHATRIRSRAPSFDVRCNRTPLRGGQDPIGCWEDPVAIFAPALHVRIRGHTVRRIGSVGRSAVVGRKRARRPHARGGIAEAAERHSPGTKPPSVARPAECSLKIWRDLTNDQRAAFVNLVEPIAIIRRRSDSSCVRPPRPLSHQDDPKSYLLKRQAKACTTCVSEQHSSHRARRRNSAGTWSASARRAPSAPSCRSRRP
jgi:hypothetical protein